MKHFRAAVLVLGLIFTLASAHAESVSLEVDEKAATAAFARQELETALAYQKIARSKDAPFRITVALAGGMAPESYTVKVAKDGIEVKGADAGGLLYGALELEEMIRLDGLQGVRDAQGKPHMPLRGIKFNIPLDARTPSYTDVSDTAQQNIATVWDYDFWTAQIDALARDRYNMISLWSLHPFPSMVKVPDYPDVALADVKRSKTNFDEYYSGNGTGFDDPKVLGEMETLKKMSIEEKIDFWRRVMAYAKSRNIDFYVITWNIFVSGTNGKYGITDKIDNATTIDYFRKSVAAMFATYPLLAGIGLTTGENMPGATATQKEEWAFKTYGQGVLDAAKAEPGRKIRFIHRQHQAAAKEVKTRFAPLIKHPDIDFVFSFKYAQAHAMSSVNQPFSKNFVKDLDGLKTMWTLRNDDNYFFRWGAPDFVREFIKNMPVDVSAGFYYGSDQWVWGREFLNIKADAPRMLELWKHWYHWMIWGRLGYDPATPNDRFIKNIAFHFPGADAPALFKTWQEASLIYPLVTGFHWGALDFQWYIEACKSRPEPAQTESGFHDVNRFITLDPHPGTDNMSIPDYVKSVRRSLPPEATVKITPPQLAEALLRHADAAIEGLKNTVREPMADDSLRATQVDIRAMALLGRYYGFKIQGATNLALFRATGKTESQDAAVEELKSAAETWREYVAVAKQQYKNPVWMNRVGIVDWDKLTVEVEKDVKIAQEAKPEK